MLVCDVSIRQSTRPPQRVIGNLFYRRLMLRRLPAIGRHAHPEPRHILGWHHCNHLAPLFEGDVLRSTTTLEETEVAAGRRRPRDGI